MFVLEWQNVYVLMRGFPDSKIHGANMAPIWGQQHPVGPHVGPMNFAIWVILVFISGVVKQWRNKHQNNTWASA